MAEALKSTANSQLVSTAGSTLACILMAIFFITSKNATSRVKLAAIMAALIVIMICVLIVLI